MQGFTMVFFLILNPVLIESGFLQSISYLIRFYILRGPVTVKWKPIHFGLDPA